MTDAGSAQRRDGLSVARPPEDVEARRLMHEVAGRLFGATAPFQIDRFEIESKLGAGANGVVYAAYDPILERRVALKTIHRGWTTRAEAHALLHEAKAAARLHHQNVVTVYEAGEAQDCVWIAMQLVDGPSLREWWRVRRRTTAEIVQLFAHVADGLAAAHAAGLVHRDFKPENVLVSRDGGRDIPRVADFGLARELGAPIGEAAMEHASHLSPELGLTRTGVLAGTPRYMAPEQFRGGRVGQRADQFSFFVALFEALHGERPFGGDSLAELEASVRTGVPRGATRRIPRWLQRSIVRGLATEPSQRWPDMRTVANELRDGPKRTRRRLGFAGGAGLALVAGLTLAPWSTAASPCTNADGGADAVWSSERREDLNRSLQQVLAETTGQGGGERLLAVLDDHLATWRAARRDVCEASEARRIAPERATSTIDCLDRVLSVHAGFLDELSRSVSSPEEVAAATERVMDLPTSGRCENPELLDARMPIEADERRLTELISLRDALDELEGALALRSAEIPRDRVDHALERARVSGWPPLVAHASILAAQAAEGRSEFEEAIELAEEALDAAIEARDAMSAARASLNLAWYEGHGRRDVEAGRRWLRIAAAHVKAARSPEKMRAELLEHEATFAEFLGDTERAIERLEAALEVRSTSAELEASAWRTFNGLGTAHFVAGHLDAAADYFDRSATLAATALGPDHPHVGRALSNLGAARRALGDDAGARQALERALAIKQRGLGPRHLEVASTLANLAPLQGDGEARVALFRESIAIVEAQLGPDDPRLANTCFNLGNELVRSGRLEEGRAFQRRFTAIQRARFGDEHPDVIVGEVAEAEVLRLLGDAEGGLTITRRWRDRVAQGGAPLLAEIDEVALHAELARSARIVHANDEADAAMARIHVLCVRSEFPDCIPEDLRSSPGG